VADDCVHGVQIAASSIDAITALVCMNVPRLRVTCLAMRRSHPTILVRVDEFR